MLRTRVITAAILIPLFILFVLKASSVTFLLLTAGFVLLGAWEWSRFVGLTHKGLRICYLFLLFLCLRVALSLYVPDVLIVVAIFWCIAFVLVALYPAGIKVWANSRAVRGVMGVLVLVPAWVALNFIRLNLNGPELLLYLCALIWCADSGAYFAGKKWGKNKLAPAVSPGKTREGLYGALATTFVIAIIGYELAIFPMLGLLPIVLVSIITVLFSVLGDLFESMMKRNVGLKDSGILIPGHGGLLDRIDSLTAAAPIFALCYLLSLKFFH